MIYRPWEAHLPAFVKVHPVEMPGRGTRICEPLCGSMEEMVEDAFLQMRPFLYQPYFMLGHSMGTIVMTELLYKFVKLDQPAPLHTFFSGRFPPHFEETKKISKLSNCEFRKEILALGGTPREILDNEDLLSFFMPIIRSDYKCIEGYRFFHDLNSWSVNMSVMYGYDDHEVKQYGYARWKDYTRGHCRFYGFTGDHFFIHQRQREVTQTVGNIIQLEVQQNSVFNCLHGQS